MDANDLYSRTYVRAKELAKRIGVSERVIRKWQYEHRIPYRQIGRLILFKVDEVEATLDKHTVAPITVTATTGTTLSNSIKALKEEVRAHKRAKRNGIKVAIPIVAPTTNTTITNKPVESQRERS